MNLNNNLNLKTKKEHFTSPLYLESGRILEPYDLIYETYGVLNEDKSNVIVVCHALTGSHHAAGRYDGSPKSGWWDGMIGSGKAIDTDKFFVICINVIGSCFGSTGPMSEIYPSKGYFRLKFPVVTIFDMVKAQRTLFDRLGIYDVYAVIGGSMGGMQALVYAVEYPQFAKKIISIGATYATQPWAIAFNKIAQEAIRKDPAFKNGYYDPSDIKENGCLGMAIGRMAGYISYLSPNSMGKKFGRNYVQTDGVYELFGRFEIDRYLEYNGYNFPTWFDPLSYLYITKAINIFDITNKYESLEDALLKIKSKLYLLSIKSDLLFLPQEFEFLAKTCQKIDLDVKYQCINSEYGHDAFLVEIEKFENQIKKALEE